jgi:hypothetical protein
LRIGFANPSNSCVFILPICYSELRWKKKKASLLGEAFPRHGDAVRLQSWLAFLLVFRSCFARLLLVLQLVFAVRVSQLPAPGSQLPEVFCNEMDRKTYFEFK